VRPKLFKYRMDAQQSKTGQYEFSSIELNNDHNLYVDYNMGMRVNLVDRGIYSLEPVESNTENYSKRLAELRYTLLSEKDKFILSEKDSNAFFADMQTTDDDKLYNNTAE
jgi:hypothetical protein